MHTVEDRDPRPIVSVIVPLHNTAATIGRTLRSLREQSLPSWECIVVDDGSEDFGPELAMRFAEEDPRIRVVRQRNQGLASARNRGMDQARGSHLMFVDADDWLLPDAMDRLVAAAAETGAAYGGSRYVRADGADLGWSFSASCPSVGVDELLECGRWVPAAQIISREKLGRERFDASWPGLEDLDLWLRVTARGTRWRAVRGDVAAYRLQRGSMSRRFTSFARVHAGLLDRWLPSTGWPIDRIHRIRGQLAINYATAETAEGTPVALQRGAGLYTELARGLSVSPDQAGHAAWCMFTYARCESPTAWRRVLAESDESAREWLGALSRWWSLLESQGAAAPGFMEDAMASFARHIADMTSVAQRLVDDLRGDGPIVLLGLGARGEHTARELVRSGREFSGFDDAVPPGTTLDIGGACIRALAATEAFDPNSSATRVVTPWRDDRLLERLPAGARIVRWADAEREASRSWHARIRSIWPERARLGVAA